MTRLRRLDAPSLGAAAALVRTRPYHAGLAAGCVGLALAGAPRAAVVLAAGAGLLVLGALRAPAVGAVVAAAVVAGAGVGAARIEHVDRSMLATRAPGALEARAILVERPRPTRFGSRATLEVAAGAATGERLVAYADRELRWPPEAGPGTEVVAEGSLRIPRSKPGDFDWPAYLRRHGIAVELRLDRMRPTGRRRGGLAGAIDAARGRAERAIEAGLEPEQEALARGMVLGQDEAVAEPVREDSRRSGLAHILTDCK